MEIIPVVGNVGHGRSAATKLDGERDALGDQWRARDLPWAFIEQGAGIDTDDRLT